MHKDRKEEENFHERKFAWIDKWVKMTGGRAKIDAKVNETYIIYETENGLVKEYPDGRIIEIDYKINGEGHESS